MNYELISPEEYAGLPEDPEECFLEFEAICRRNMMRMMEENPSEGLGRVIRNHYVTSVAVAAEECGIPVMSVPTNGADLNNYYYPFSASVQGQIAKIRLRNRKRFHAFSVQLSPNTKSKIEHYISTLRDLIGQSDLPPDRKEVLGSKLDELVSELGNKRVSFAKVMAVLGYVVAGVAGVTTIAADGPTAVTNIMRLIAKDKETEDAAIQRLAPSPKALPPPATIGA